MTFLEKSAWVMIAALIVSGAVYANAVLAMSSAMGAIAPPNVGLIIGVTIVIIVIAIFGHTVAALMNTSDAEAPEDERDRIVAWRAGNMSNYILSLSVMLGLSLYALTGVGNLLFHVLVGGLVIAQIIEYALTIVFYRRGV
ncbi:MAG: hypothetical protein ABJH52_09570 [Henriciella sp.]